MLIKKREEVLIISRCPHCSMAHPHLERHTVHPTKTGRWEFYLARCCNNFILVQANRQNPDEVIAIFPEPKSVASSIPSPVHDYLTQAIETMNAPVACIMVAASAIDGMLKDRGLKEGNLYSRIDRAKEENIITPDMANWAHDVRLDANEQRHADAVAGLPTIEDAERCVEFALALAEYIYVLPARVKRGRKPAVQTEATAPAGGEPHDEKVDENLLPGK
jgi:hypothetical protein